VRFVNVVGQRVLAAIRRREPITLKPRIRRYSHVMLGVGDGLIIHADGKTVAVEVISDALHHATSEASRFQVYRRRDASVDVTAKIVTSAMRYYNQRYRFSTYFNTDPGGDTTMFCSRLVAHAYRSAGAQLTPLQDNRVLPVDLYQICQSKEWMEITSEFVVEPVDAAVDELFPSIELPDQGSMSLSEFLAHVDALITDRARMLKQREQIRYDSTREILYGDVSFPKCVDSSDPTLATISAR
jgi:hypothetical protein